ncbi:MAG: hypothetical protein MRY64_04035 [Hyphomonadaceae bacterium]|nr:hypothetical protein [Hyphomonadaceae bacterium]
MLAAIARVTAWTLLIAYTGLLVWLSLRAPSAEPQPAGLDKLYHFLAYGGLMALMVAALGMGRMWRAFLLASIFGFTMELAQATLSAVREPSLLDGLANMTGAGLAGVLIILIGRVWAA